MKSLNIAAATSALLAIASPAQATDPTTKAPITGFFSRTLLCGGYCGYQTYGYTANYPSMEACRIGATNLLRQGILFNDENNPGLKGPKQACQDTETGETRLLKLKEQKEDVAVERFWGGHSRITFTKIVEPLEYVFE